MDSHLKVLVSAYACHPEMGSEAGVGWNCVQQIARYHETWVLTRTINRPAIERALAQQPLPQVHWIYFDLPRWAGFWEHDKYTWRVYYTLWQIGAYLVARRLLHEQPFDIVHHLTWGCYWLPSFLALLPIPFVWGPVGGGDAAPLTFYRSLGWYGGLYEWLRGRVQRLSELNPFVRLTARRARVTLVNTEATKRKVFALSPHNDVIVYSHMGIGVDEIVPQREVPAGTFRFVSIGRLLHWKGFHLGVEAFAQFQQECPHSEYWIIGEGPERQALSRLAKKLGVSDRVRFWGQLTRAETLQKLRECSVLVHPALHDSAPGVCLEAMAAGCPVLCLNIGGPAVQVTPETGVLVTALAPEQAMRDMVAGMRQLANDCAWRRNLAEAGRTRIAQHFTWDAKGEYFHKLYVTILNAHTAYGLKSGGHRAAV